MDTPPPPSTPSSNESNEDDDDPAAAYGESPIHSSGVRVVLGCDYRPFWTIATGFELACIYKKDPFAVFARDRNGDLPLHIACRYFSRHSNQVVLIRLLTHRYPQAWATANYHGEYPLHILLFGQEVPINMATSIIYENVERCETSACQQMLTITTTATMTKRTTEYPLHMYLRKLKKNIHIPCGSDIALKARLIVQKLAEYCPEALVTMSPVDGQLPIHLACSQTSSLFDLQTIQAMHRGDNVSALSFPDRKLPIQYALENHHTRKNNRDIIFYLCLQFPSCFIATTRSKQEE
ncbi:hypothetical protein ACA910_021796 [Epithemia clementina (nom. ined.)]